MKVVTAISYMQFVPLVAMPVTQCVSLSVCVSEVIVL